ncbi:hypothetical protein EV191_109239 [Tamaricihabitans halophyticus]|uniref:DUF5319 domain-containing protein n=1 Tax=Tamaricihabitans halophyticus TaxID=1262583 RepID=A0A4R2QJG6_9PSEU|nr:DUF5319 domain-containing protein [Tamaricihabitans halophyticus]TCP49417.1 hypothetical protein EV191_109239 [Tamaricihabitans halophyticus]
MPHDALPPDPFANDPDDPARALQEPIDEPGDEITSAERAELLADLADLAVYQTLLEPRGMRGIVVDCGECAEPHFHDWSLLRASLEQLLDNGYMRPHEPAFDPDPANYVSWDYCRGFADGVTATENARRAG